MPWPIRQDAPIFTTAKGRRVNIDNWRKRTWNPALERAGLPHRPLYQMRHTYATLALAEGATLEWIAEQMGHTDTRTTKRHYARFVKRVDDRMLGFSTALDPVTMRSPQRSVSLRETPWNGESRLIERLSEVELGRFELTTSWVRSRRSPN